MSNMEILLGSSIIKQVAAVWLNIRGESTNATLSELAIDSQKVSDSLTRRRLNRELDRLVDTVADRLSTVVDTEFRDLPAVVKSTLRQCWLSPKLLSKADLSKESLLAADFDPMTLYQQIRRSSGGIDHLDLSESATNLYNLLLKEACTEIVQIASSLPTFSNDAISEVLRRETDLIQRVEQLLSTLPMQDASDPVQVFESSYRRALVSRLDHLELVGGSYLHRLAAYR